MHVRHPEDNLDSNENPRGTGVTRAALWGSPGTPARPPIFWLKVFWGPFALSFGLPKFGKPVEGNFVPLGQVTPSQRGGGL